MPRVKPDKRSNQSTPKSSPANKPNAKGKRPYKGPPKKKPQSSDQPALSKSAAKRRRTAARRASRKKQGAKDGSDDDDDSTSSEIEYEAGPSTPAGRGAGGASGKGKQRAAYEMDDDEEEAANGPSKPMIYTPSAFTPIPRSILKGVDHAGVVTDDNEVIASPSISLNPKGKGKAPAGGKRAAKDPLAMLETSLIPDPIPQSRLGKTSTTADEPEAGGADDSLVLPGHVKLDGMGEGGGEDGEDEEDQSDVSMDGLHFLDSDIMKGAARYFDPDLEDPDSDAAFLASADQRKICQMCKRPGHHSRQCPHVVCSLCGAIDEHPRQHCPHGIICFNCDKVGHQVKDCPEPRRPTGARFCQLCRNPDHRNNTCPSLWRTYVYYTPEQRSLRTQQRNEAKGWAAEAIGGNGGVDHCYNCAAKGHLGDDCPRRRGSLARSSGPSAFSFEITRSGPFGGSFATTSRSADTNQGTHSRFGSPDGEDGNLLPGQNAFRGHNPGQRGREKARNQQRQYDRELGASDDEYAAVIARLSSHARGRNGNGSYGQASTPRQQQSNRPWDSDIRGVRGAAGGEAMPFGHAHLMTPDANAPSSLPARRPGGKGIAFGRFDADANSPGVGTGSESGVDTPTGRGGARGRGGFVARGGTRMLVERALGIQSQSQSQSKSQFKPQSSYHPSPTMLDSPSVKSVPARRLYSDTEHTEGDVDALNYTNGNGNGNGVSGGSASGSGVNSAASSPRGHAKRSRSKRNKAESSGDGNGKGDGERDWETEWRATGAGGGSVQGWGREHDEVEKMERRAGKGAGAGGGGRSGMWGAGGGGNGGNGGEGDGGAALGIKGAALRFVQQKKQGQGKAQGHGPGQGQGQGHGKSRGQQGQGQGKKDERDTMGPVTPASRKGKGGGGGGGPRYTGGY